MLLSIAVTSISIKYCYISNLCVPVPPPKPTAESQWILKNCDGTYRSSAEQCTPLSDSVSRSLLLIERAA